MAVEIGVMDLNEVKGNGSTSRMECEAMNLHHTRHGLCPMELGTETIFLQDNVKPCGQRQHP